MSKKQVFLITFFTFLVIGFFVVISFVIPDFGKPKMPAIGTVRPFKFVNQDGQPITEKDVKGKVTVVNFFFTTCKSICPRMNNNLRTVYEQFKDYPDFIILSHTCDPERDSVQRIKHYSDSMHVNSSRWMFLTGRKDSLYAAARLSYKIDDPKNFVANINDDFLHTQLIALLNKKGEVVHIYDGIKPSEMREMADKIQLLLR
ncbi:MAG TPA: SCO family protein [Flavisolibacter sp.]|nr:SCO family protein [Flavisolibacter sp.]